MDILSGFSATNVFLIFIGAFIIGLAKAGLKGIDMLNVTIMAIVFGGKASTGIVLPLLCIADIGAVLYYNRHAQWKYFWKIMVAENPNEIKIFTHVIALSLGFRGNI